MRLFEAKDTVSLDHPALLLGTIRAVRLSPKAKRGVCDYREMSRLVTIRTVFEGDLDRDTSKPRRSGALMVL